MKVLSVQQPWASLIAAGIKDVENRTWKPQEIPERILIHASKKCSNRTMRNEDIELLQEMLNEIIQGSRPEFLNQLGNSVLNNEANDLEKYLLASFLLNSITI